MCRKPIWKYLTMLLCVLPGLFPVLPLPQKYLTLFQAEIAESPLNAPFYWQHRTIFPQLPRELKNYPAHQTPFISRSQRITAGICFNILFIQLL
jgi:hypothetical protein